MKKSYRESPAEEHIYSVYDKNNIKIEELHEWVTY